MCASASGDTPLSRRETHRTTWSFVSEQSIAFESLYANSITSPLDDQDIDSETI